VITNIYAARYYYEKLVSGDISQHEFKQMEVLIDAVESWSKAVKPNQPLNQKNKTKYNRSLKKKGKQTKKIPAKQETEDKPTIRNSLNDISNGCLWTISKENMFESIGDFIQAFRKETYSGQDTFDRKDVICTHKQMSLTR
jgi:hypothetical protein